MNGALGGNGAKGPPGPPGPQGPPGKDAKVACNVKRRGEAKFRVTCTVVLDSARQSALRWRLLHHGRVYDHGVAVARYGRVTVRIPGVNRLPRGRYVLQISGRARGTTFVIG